MRSFLSLPLLAALGGCMVPPSGGELAPTTSGPSASADAPAIALDHRIDDRLAAADAVVLARVTSIDHALSADLGDQGYHLPHSFVTIDVLDGIAGADTGDQITLRFLGGPIDDHILTVSGIPRLQVGDTFFGLIYANGDHACPLVSCRDGLLRVDGDQVILSDGSPIAIVDDHAVLVATDDGGADAIDPASVEDVADWLAEHSADLDLPGVASLDPTAPFELRRGADHRPMLHFSEPEAAEAAPLPAGVPTPVHRVDAAEQRCLEQNAFDPTLPAGC